VGCSVEDHFFVGPFLDRVDGYLDPYGYGHSVDDSLAQGYVPRELAEDAVPGAFEVEILGGAAGGDAHQGATVRSERLANAVVGATGVVIDADE
jgi:hypothetical protein